MRVRRLLGERFQQDCQAARVQAGRGSAKSPLVLLDRNVNGVVYLDILRDTLVPYARQHFEDKFRYKDDNAMTHGPRVVTDYLQQYDITKMDKPAQSSDCNPIEILWD